jgi:hypothetical protein
MNLTDQPWPLVTHFLFTDPAVVLRPIEDSPAA